MKQLLLIFSLILCSTGIVIAQDYAVYRVKGEVCQVVKNKKIVLQKGMKVTMKDILNMGNHSELKLFDEKRRQMVTLKNQCAGSLKSLINSQKESVQNMTADYFSYILKNMSGQGQEDRMLAGRTTAIFRDDADSLLVKTDSVGLKNNCPVSADSTRCCKGQNNCKAENKERKVSQVQCESEKK